MIKTFKIFESLSLWDDFIDKFNRGVVPTDPPNSNVINNLIEMIPSNSKVLDLSFGNGVDSEYFIKRGFDVYGTDISNIAVETMKEKYPDYNWILHNTLEPFSFFSNNKFDLIYSRLSLHYFNESELESIFSELDRMTKNGGYVYMMVKLSNSGNVSTGKVSFTKDKWEEVVSNYFNIIDAKSDLRKGYSFEREPSNLLEIIAQK